MINKKPPLFPSEMLWGKRGGTAFIFCRVPVVWAAWAVFAQGLAAWGGWVACATAVGVWGACASFAAAEVPDACADRHGEFPVQPGKQ